MTTKRFDLNDRLLDLAITIAGIVRSIPDDRIGHHVARQLIRSGTAPAAHHAEAQSAESRRDFIHKLKLSVKELRETRTWLRMVARMDLTADRVESVLEECDQLIAILVVSIRTASTKKAANRATVPASNSEQDPTFDVER